jgi:hypothetical protein
MSLALSGESIERRESVGRRERVDGERTVRRAVKPGGCSALARSRKSLPRSGRVGGRRAERAEAIENARLRRDRSAALRIAGPAPVGLRDAGQVDDPPQHFDERAGQRQVRPARVGADMEQDERALAAPLAGDERRAVR